ncbi:hypothetical protein Leryth_021594 [Lithospermum erythrorhizon]|nr:hypothetical protein Leryth_021594 [Lithospermum erythrorhizon]
MRDIEEPKRQAHFYRQYWFLSDKEAGNLRGMDGVNELTESGSAILMAFLSFVFRICGRSWRISIKEYGFPSLVNYSLPWGTKANTLVPSPILGYLGGPSQRSIKGGLEGGEWPNIPCEIDEVSTCFLHRPKVEADVSRELPGPGYYTDRKRDYLHDPAGEQGEDSDDLLTFLYRQFSSVRHGFSFNRILKNTFPFYIDVRMSSVEANQ